jgi:hypothetical protein
MADGVGADKDLTAISNEEVINGDVDVLSLYHGHPLWQWGAALAIGRMVFLCAVLILASLASLFALLLTTAIGLTNIKRYPTFQDNEEDLGSKYH